MRYAVLLRGVNLGPHNRVGMPALRALLERAGFDDVRTYLQSGNVVLAGRGPESRVRTACREAIEAGLGLEVDVLVRSLGDLERVVERNPLAGVATNPKRYQVTFLERRAAPGLAERLEAAASPAERVAVDGREIYAWHPGGVGRSRLASLLGGWALGVVATSRNWTTVSALLELT